MSEQTATSQVEEVAPVAAANVQPEAVVEAPVADKKVVDETEKPAEESKEAEAATTTTTTTTTAKVGEEDVVAQEKPVVEAAESTDAVAKEDSTGKVSSEEKTNGDVEKVTESKVDEASNKVGEPIADSNGAAEADKKEETLVEETNGVCKRKADNGAEAVEDEKSPKKAKVVDDGDQAPVEETAA